MHIRLAMLHALALAQYATACTKFVRTVSQKVAFPGTVKICRRETASHGGAGVVDRLRRHGLRLQALQVFHERRTFRDRERRSGPHVHQSIQHRRQIRRTMIVEVGRGLRNAA